MLRGYESITVEPGDNTVEPGDNTVEPGDNNVEPGDNTVEPGDNTVEPGDNNVATDNSKKRLKHYWKLFTREQRKLLLETFKNEYLSDNQ
jgi:hypothetical protein